MGRAGRFGTKGLAISFISSEEDGSVLNDVQSKFVVSIPELPDEIDASTYSEKIHEKFVEISGKILTSVQCNLRRVLELL